MGDFTLTRRTCTSDGQRVGVINGKTYGAIDLYVQKSNPPRSSIPPTTSKDVNLRPTVPKPQPWYSDRELKRRKRIATYKYYSVEGKVKSSFRKSIRWIKNTCSKIAHGF
ncbi:hypothetical protein Fot_50678 [Forsythia ovata]|uniref:Uncharacterized protein n=1 Tax=Forsythia ovata TaxID=205694 RepID=A0ABD1PZU9_9LAMI